MPLTPAFSAGPSALASARHLALPSPGSRRDRLEDRIRTAVHRRTGRGDVKRQTVITSAILRTRAGSPGTTTAPAGPPALDRAPGQRVGKRLIGLAAGVTALGALLVLGLAGTLSALLVAAG
ncbi:hypothetical protein [Zhihengliuella salsuginis]|uniref:Uncharacterized protein n=1 Tax=Zhihengliuella salsuginis TaxID=578222 RepID=A0ABQ3GJL3_9MICC|nr:hypothetical protein [Zhihengliuella salsuginis]GHD10929.1 hypothetical protein GCM10008096_24990 [Zhihengliuella salsuginis]